MGYASGRKGTVPVEGIPHTDSNNEVIEHLQGAQAEVNAGRGDATKRADGSWVQVRTVATPADVIAGTSNSVDMTPKGVADAIAQRSDKRTKVKMLVDVYDNAFPERWSAAVTEDNEIIYWGYNANYGILGRSAPTNPQAVVTIAQPLAKRSVLIKGIYTFTWGMYVLYEDGDLYVIGYNGYGQLGIGNTANQFKMILSNTNVSSIAITGAGYHQDWNSALIIKTDGSVWGTGNNDYGNLGVGDSVNKTTWTPAVGLPDPAIDPAVKVIFADIRVSTGYVLTQSGKVYSSGYNGYGHVGNGTTTNTNSFAQVTTNIGTLNVVDITCNGGMRASTSAYYRGGCFALTDTGRLFGWGYNGNGELGIGNQTVTISSPTEVVYGHDNVADPIAKIHASGHAYNMAGYITTSGALYVWGYDAWGGLGIGSASDAAVTTPTLVSVSNVRDIYWSVGGTYQYKNQMIVTNDWRVFCSGYNSQGAVGDDNATIAHARSPVEIALPQKPIKQVSYGGYSDLIHWLVLFEDGEVWGWGSAAQGELIHNVVTLIPHPTNLRL